jgi:hypothetical protein
MLCKSSPSLVARFEIVFACLIIAASWVVCSLNINSLGYAGQDFPLHTMLLGEARSGVYRFGSQSPPGIYFLGAQLCKFFSPGYVMEAISHLCVALNIAAVAVWYWMLRKTCSSSFMRLGGLAIISLLPLRNITAVVYAADTLTTLPFALMVPLLVAQRHSTRLWQQIVFAVLNGIVWCAGLYAKFTFITIPIAITIVAVIWLISPQSAGKRWALIISLVVGAIIPLLVGTHMYIEMKKANSMHFALVDFGKGIPWREVFFIKSTDTSIFKAPQFTCARNMDAAVGVSYPSLVHLGTFSDIWNFGQTPAPQEFSRPRPLTECFPRTRTPHATLLSPISIILSVLISLVVIVAVLYQSIALIISSYRTSTVSVDIKLISLLLGVAFCLPPTLRLPYYNSVYIFGFWTPRLILPGLLSLLVLGFASLDQLLRGRPLWIHRILLGYCLTMAAIYALIV